MGGRGPYNAIVDRAITTTQENVSAGKDGNESDKHDETLSWLTIPLRGKTKTLLRRETMTQPSLAAVGKSLSRGNLGRRHLRQNNPG